MILQLLNHATQGHDKTAKKRIPLVSIPLQPLTRLSSHLDLTIKQRFLFSSGIQPPASPTASWFKDLKSCRAKGKGQRVQTGLHLNLIGTPGLIHSGCWLALILLGKEGFEL
ncbi:hypothetical protein Y1Q_0022611 [Alligator mississippiensis]|uniref:Uncharacterized protein n=1 Tax=Alligator mississippiensis TaxID=8496 RepID=A0A151NQD0_ALLMI|nr:hypothetical protein Y1Q_0022611 [Alligator mississippiensis]